MSRIIFRVLMGLTLAVMYLSRGRMQVMLFLPFYTWFLASGVVFGAFGIYSAYRAWCDPTNRRAYMLDILLAASWLVYWIWVLTGRSLNPAATQQVAAFAIQVP